MSVVSKNLNEYRFLVYLIACRCQIVIFCRQCCYYCSLSLVGLKRLTPSRPWDKTNVHDVSDILSKIAKSCFAVQ